MILKRWILYILALFDQEKYARADWSDWWMTFYRVTDNEAKNANWSVGRSFGILKSVGAVRSGYQILRW